MPDIPHDCGMVDTGLDVMYNVKIMLMQCNQTD